MKSPRVTILSVIALFFIFLTFTVNWLFIVVPVIIAGINWKILMNDK